MAKSKTGYDRKQIAVQFLQSVVAGQIDEAYRKHVDMKGTHHNPYFPAGIPALQKAMAENQTEMPHKKLVVKHTLGDGDFVAVHSHLITKPGDNGMIVVHLFRFRDDKIVEFWDCGQPLPADSPNAVGPF